MTARPITKIAVVQISLVVIFFFVLGITMKAAGYPHRPDPEFRWNSFAVFLRTYGMWLLLLPAVWAVFCHHAERKWNDWSDSDTLVCGIATALLIMGVFLVAACLSLMSHSTLVKVSIPPPAPKISQRFNVVEDAPASPERR
jgi:hypothetical protein